ncbi:hypothetical protein Indivirus_2_60 [Indivirus ILV1]|uniref:Uncharacterized protein n=1 Tax=Indivirus ILV1 TaxID=1977633 RepID=A0A1V0SDB3_9VIRU|nr:hypothetical protein Indivirus_2_60 [Indivirus ILV1]
MLHFKQQQPTDHFTLPKNGKVIMKNGTPINDHYVSSVIEEMINRRLTLDKSCIVDGFPARHSASFITGTSNWREKDLIWGKFDPGGTSWVLLWTTC